MPRPQGRSQRRLHRRPLVAAATIASAAALAAATGCNYISAAQYIIDGPPTVPAVADLQPDRPTVIFVDDRGYGDRNIIPKRALRRDIGRVAQQTLLDRGVVDEGMMIRSEDALRVASTESADNPMSVVDIARAVGADVVVYADVRAFTISRDNSTVSPAAAARVKIFDAANNQQIWPPDGGSHELVAQMPREPRDLTTLERADEREAEQALAAFVGLRLAQMFFEIERPSRLGTSER